MDGSHRGSIDPIRLCDLTSVSLVLSEKEYSIRVGLSRGKGNGLMERYCAREDVGLAGNDRMLTLSIENMRDDKAYISMHNAYITHKLRKMLEK